MLSFSVAWKGESLQVELPPESQLGELAAELAQHFGVAPETVKLLGPGKVGMLKAGDHPERTLALAGIPPGSKLKLLASSAGEVAAVKAARDLPALAPLDVELEREVRRAQRDGSSDSGGLQAPPSPYTFQRLEPWQRPGLTPPPSEALKLLRRLASDPGIAAVMAHHRWTVGLLSEMPPEGKVGISPMCILGVNVNKGQEVSLRLRTDDLKGFRRYDRIIETLIHELAHMVHSEHDNNFKALNSQLRQEAAAADWRGARAVHALQGPAYEGCLQYDLPPSQRGAMAQTAQLSGKTLRELAGGEAEPGPSSALPASAKAAAAAAALQRMQVAAAGAGAVNGAGPVMALQSPGGQQPLSASQPQQQPVRQQQVWQRPLKKGDLVWYRQRDGSWAPTQVVAVDSSVQPPSYGIATEGLGGAEGGGGLQRDRGLQAAAQAAWGECSGGGQGRGGA